MHQLSNLLLGLPWWDEGLGLYNFDTWKLLIFQDCSDLIHLGQQSNSLWLKLTILVYPSWGSKGLDDISARYTEGLWTRWQRASERKASCDNYIPFLLHLFIDYKTCSPVVSFNLLKSLVISFHSFLWMNKLKLMKVGEGSVPEIRTGSNGANPVILVSVLLHCSFTCTPDCCWILCWR